MGFVKTAYDIARKQVFFCDAGQPLVEVAESMHRNNIGSILVKKGEELAGIITVNDFLRLVSSKRNPYNKKARDIMSSPVITADKDLEIDQLVEVFNKKKVSRMVLTDSKGKIVGVVRDIAVYKYYTFFKYDAEAKKRFARDYLHKLY
jgi:predicted transcriptional regulator